MGYVLTNLLGPYYPAIILGAVFGLPILFALLSWLWENYDEEICTVLFGLAVIALLILAVWLIIKFPLIAIGIILLLILLVLVLMIC